MQSHGSDVIDIVKKIICSNDLFVNYSLRKWNINKLFAERIDYDFILDSDNYNRWMLFRISDFGKYQKVIIWLNCLDVPKAANFDLQVYFYSNLNIHNIEERLRFDSIKTHDFAKGLQYVLNYIMSKLDLNGKLIFEGKLWVDFPFDWHGYK